MLNPNSTIYQNEWLDLVFANRNQSYGAYELRRNYNKRMSKALLLTLAFVITLVGYVRFAGNASNVEVGKKVEFDEHVLTFPNLIQKEQIIIPKASPSSPSK